MNPFEGCAEIDPVAIRQPSLIPVVAGNKRVKYHLEGLQAGPEVPGLGGQGGDDLLDALVAEKFG